MHPLSLYNSDPIYYCLWLGHVMCCLYFVSSRERFALLKSPRMIKTESGCFCSVSVIRSVSFCTADLAFACGGM